MKVHAISSLLFTGLVSAATAGPVASVPSVATPDAFSRAIHPISNPTLTDLPLAQTTVHAMAMHQQLPSQISLAGGGSLALGGDLNVLAVQLEYAFNDRFSLIATKDGYIDFNPDVSLPKESGFANLAAGFKYAFYRNEATATAFAGTAIVEVPSGNRDVLQGYGSGSLNLSVHGLKLTESGWQFSGSTGVHLPFDGDEESLTGFTSAHVSYQLTERLTPLVEINWQHVFSEGNGTETPISGATSFEGGHLINLGAGSVANKDIVTAALGLRYRVNDSVQLGAAYEIPLTNDEENLMESRVTVDLVWTF